MNWLWMNIPLMAVFFAAWTGIPLWLSLRHPDTGPAMPVASTPADDVATVLQLELAAELIGQD
jgi:hypothetical protein